MRRFVVLASSALALGLVSGAAAALSPQALLKRYQPVLVLERTELYRPTPVEPFLAGSDLQQRAADKTWTTVGPAGELPTGDPPGCRRADGFCYRLDARVCSAVLGLTQLSCYAALAGDPRPPSTMYGRAVRFGNRTVLQYWLFYPYNLWTVHYPQSEFIWRSHEGDWELVSVVLSSAKQEPVYAAYSQHCSGERRAWAKVRKWRRTAHPVAYVGLGSHANYFTPGTHPHAPQCWPEAAHIVFKAHRVTPRDFTGGGPVLGPDEPGVQPVALARITTTTPSWMRFPGYWGETGYFHAPGIETVTYGQGPDGPAFHDTWQKPLATVLKWRLG